MTSDLTPSDIKLDLGCGNNKKRGYIGIDIQNFPDVDYILDVTTERLPFEDNSVSEVYSSHLFEHFDNPEKVLKEIIRVCRHRARVQIWTPHLWANDAFVLGHRVFYNEASWRHICIYHPDIWQRGTKGRLVLECFKYVLTPDITDNLEEMRIPLRFALNHFSNIAFEFCAEMTVYKKGNPHLKNPVILTSYSRNGTFLTLEKEDFSIKI